MLLARHGTKTIMIMDGLQRLDKERREDTFFLLRIADIVWERERCLSCMCKVSTTGKYGVNVREEAGRRLFNYFL